jgi:hypothetical protein
MKKVLFNLTDEQFARLKKLADRMGVSTSEALRRSIQVYQFVKESQQKGAEIHARSKDGKDTVVEIIG